MPGSSDATVVRSLVVSSGNALARGALQAGVPRSLVDVQRVEPLGRGLAVVDVRTPSSVSAAIAGRMLVRAGAVSSAAAQRHFSAQGAQAPRAAADSRFAAQWALWDSTSTARAGGYGIDAPRAWTQTSGSASVVVAVLDTGITAHPNLAGMHEVPGFDFVGDGDAGTGTGDDAYDADPSDPGDACTESGSTSDSSWHGTFVTGEIAAQAGTGVAGVAPGVSIEPVRVLGPCGGDEGATIRGLLWAAGLPVQVVDSTGAATTLPLNPNRASVISLSLGGAGVCDDAMQSAVDQAVAAGAVVVAAAGNDGGPIADSSPADCSGVVSVVATSRRGAVASYSDTGTAEKPATIAAPGGDAVPSGTGLALTELVLGDSWTDTGDYTGLASHATLQYDAGTSMATPLVSASIALLRSLHPELTPVQVVSRLVATATPFPAAAKCTTDRCGAGIVNAGDLVGAPKRFVLAVSPRIGGRARLGGLLHAQAGVWRDEPGWTTYQWTRDGRPVARETHAVYRVHRQDLGHRLAVTVTVHHRGWDPATATAPAVRVPR